MAPASSRVYPIAETFLSIQGEGFYTGVMMNFIRLAGCNVGRYKNDLPIVADLLPSDLKLYESGKHSMCETALGQRFLCDTDYHRSERCSAEYLMEKVTADHICITGGEPFMHDLFPIIEAAGWRQVHIETSGTLPIPNDYCGHAWITCSPKRDFVLQNINLVDEWKFVIGGLEDIDKLLHFIDACKLGDEARIYLQPVNHVNSVNPRMLELVLACIEKYPHFMLSAQLHKYLGVR